MTESSEDMMSEINKRFQVALLESVDKQVEELEDVIEGKNALIAEKEKMRSDLAESLFGVQHELVKLKDSLEKSRLELEQTKSENLYLQTQNQVLERNITQITNRYEEAQETIEDMRKRSEITQEEIIGYQHASKAFKSEIQSYKQLEVGLLRDLEKAKSDITKENKVQQTKEETINALSQEKLQLERQLEAQVNETKVAQRAIEKMADDLNSVMASKSTLLRQWEEALDAMNRRDLTLEQVNKQKEDIQAERGIIKLQYDDLLKSHSNVSQKMESTDKRLSETISELKSMKSTVEKLKAEKSQLEKQLRITKNQNSIFEQDAKKAHHDVEVRQENLNNLTEAAQKAKFQMGELKQELLQLKSANEHLSQVFDKERGQLEAELSYNKENLEEKLSHSENQRQTLEYKALQLEQALEDFMLQNKNLSSHFEDMKRKFNQVSSEAAKMQEKIWEWERKENFTHAKLEQKTQEKIKTETEMKNRVEQLELMLRSRDEELRRMQELWVDAQRELQGERQNHLELRNNHGELEKREKVQDIVRHRLHRDLQKTESERNQNAVDTQRVQVELKRLHQQLCSMKKEKEDMEKQILNSSAVLNIRSSEFETDVNILQFTIVQLKKELEDTKATIIKLHLEKQTAEKRQMLAQEELEKKRNELKKSNQQNFELNLQLSSAAKSMRESQNQFQQYIKQFELYYASKNQLRLGKILKRTSSSQTQFTSVLSSEEEKSGETTDLRRIQADLISKLNHTMSQSAERLNEIVQLRQQYEDARAQLLQKQQLLEEVQRKMTKSQAKIRELNYEQITTQNRCSRAEALAASFEAQLRQLVSSESISYEYMPDLEPSQELARVLNTPFLTTDEICHDIPAIDAHTMLSRPLSGTENRSSRTVKALEAPGLRERSYIEPLKPYAVRSNHSASESSAKSHPKSRHLIFP